MEDHILPLVTYIVPSFNHEAYVEECLNSILNDDYPKKELLIVDDGSVDNSIEIIRKWINIYSNKIDVSLFIQSNMGISKTLNHMINHSLGKYIRFIASDDLVEKKSTFKLLNGFENNYQGCVFGDCKIIDNKSMIIYKSSLLDFHKRSINNYKTINKLNKEIILNWSIFGPSSMYSKNIFAKVGKFDNNLIIEDWDMFIRLAKINSLKFIPEIVASYRFHKNNTSRYNSTSKRLEILRHIKYTIKKNISNDVNYENRLLKIKINHINAKISYLSRNYISAGLQYFYYIIRKLFI